MTAQANRAEFSGEPPEHDTLIALALRRPVKVFQMEHSITGQMMCLAHFDHEGWTHLYQDGDGAQSCHLFFWIAASSNGEPAESLAVGLFQGQFVLSPIPENAAA